MINSNAVTISGITAFATVTVSGDNGFAKYNVGCDTTTTFVSTPGKIGPGQTICIQQIASSTFGEAETATLTVGGVSAFTITTKAATAPPPASTAVVKAEEEKVAAARLTSSRWPLLPH